MITKYQARKSRQYKRRSRPGVGILFALTSQIQKIKVGAGHTKVRVAVQV